MKNIFKKIINFIKNTRWHMVYVMVFIIIYASILIYHFLFIYDINTRYVAHQLCYRIRLREELAWNSWFIAKHSNNNFNILTRYYLMLFYYTSYIVLELIFWVAYVIYWYLVFIELLLDSTYLFIFDVMDLDDYIKKHPRVDEWTKFFESREYYDFVNYCNEEIFDFYLYLPSYIFGYYESFCTIVWDWCHTHVEFVSFLYSCISAVYLMFLVFLQWLNSFLKSWSSLNFSLIGMFADIFDDILLVLYPKIYSADFINGFSFFSYIDYVSKNKHPRGTNFITIVVLSLLSDRWFKTNLIDKILLIFYNNYLRITLLFKQITQKRFKFLIFFLIFFYIPAYKTCYLQLIFLLLIYLLLYKH